MHKPRILVLALLLTVGGCGPSGSGTGLSQYYTELNLLTATVVLSAIAVLISIITAIRSRVYRKRVDDASLYLARNVEFKHNLAKWPSAFKLYGIDIGCEGVIAVADSEEAVDVTAEQITYLILSVNALRAYCLATGRKYHKVLGESEYRENQFSQPATKAAWEYARKCVSGDIRDAVDKYIETP